MTDKTTYLHPIVLAAIGAVLVIAIASIAYYFIESAVPVVPVQTSTTVATSTISASGIVEPAQNPDLAFQSGGRVARINVAVGASVSQGELLASLDTASLSAQRAQAEATLKMQQAKLDEMQAGPRQVDVSAKQTAVSQAQLSLTNLYQNVANAVSDAYGKSYGAFHTDTDVLFGNPNSASPTLVFTTTNNQNATTLINDRIGMNAELSTWQQSVTALNANSSEADLEKALTDALSHLQALRAYSNATVAALSDTVPSSGFPTNSINTSLAAANTMRDSVSTLITSLQAMSQQLASTKLTIQSAQDALSQVQAGATSQDIEAQQAQVEAAQANVSNFDAQIANAQIIAPYAGTISSVRVKTGDIVAPDTDAISLNPRSALQINAYVSEADVASISPASSVDVTLDAYGSDRHFSATVVSVDRSPTIQNGVPAYKVTLQFAANDPAISSGMTANITFTR